MDATTPSSLRQRQLSAFMTILDWLFRIVVSTASTLAVVALASGLRIEIIGLALASAGYALCVASSRQQLRNGKIAASLALMFTPMFLIGIGMALFFRGGSYLLGLATIMAMLIVGMLLSVRAALWLTGGGLAAFFGFVLLAGQGFFDRFYGPAGSVNDYLVPIVALTAMMFIGVLAYILNQSLQDSLREAEERGRLAEAAQAAQAAQLTRIQDQAAQQERLLSLVRDLETPVIPVLEGVLVLPIVGHLDTQRIATLTAALLDKVAQQRAHMVLVDLTGVPLLDAATAHDLLQLIQAVRLLGAEVMLTGIRAEVAQTVATLGISLKGIKTAASLQAGIRQAGSTLPHAL